MNWRNTLANSGSKISSMRLPLNLPFNLPMVGTFLCAALLSVVAAYFTALAVEDASEDGVLDALEAKNMDWVEVHAEGLNVFLTGVAPQESDRFIALSVAGTVVDAARVIDNMDVQASVALAPPKFSIEILRNDATSSSWRRWQRGRCSTGTPHPHRHAARSFP